MSAVARSLPVLDGFAFARDGFLVLRNCLPQASIDSHGARLAALFLRSEPPSGLPTHPAVLRRRHVRRLRASGAAGLALHDQLLSSLNQLVGERCYLLDVLTPESTQVLPACDSYDNGEPYLTAWIALRNQPIQAGLRVWPGSHLRNRQSLRRLLAAEPDLAQRMRRMHEEGASLDAWRDLEGCLIDALYRRADLSSGMRLVALNKGDILIHQQGLTLSPGRLDARSCVVARYGAEQLHRNPYFMDSAG